MQALAPLSREAVDGCPIPRGAQGQAGWDPELPELGGGIPTHGMGEGVKLDAL